MPSPNAVHTYDLTQNYLYLGGIRIQGFGDDAAVSYEFDADKNATAVGADGEVSFSRQNNNLMVATITCKETSKAAGILSEMEREQRDQEVIGRLSYAHRDRIGGDIVTDEYAVFLQTGAPSKSRDAGEREFRIALPNGAASLKLNTQKLDSGDRAAIEGLFS